MAIYLAPRIKLISHAVHVQAPAVKAKIIVNGLRISVLNGYAPTEITECDTTKDLF